MPREKTGGEGAKYVVSLPFFLGGWGRGGGGRVGIRIHLGYAILATSQTSSSLPEG